MQIGTRIGPYEIRQPLGQGGMAQVWKAWHLGLHRFEALKIPLLRSTEAVGQTAIGAQIAGMGQDTGDGEEAEVQKRNSEQAFIARFLHEARIGASLRHSHIATIYSVSEVDAPEPYFAMELVEGGDLAELIQVRGRLSLGEALPILEAIASALDYAHAQGVIHRDIKPANVLLEARPHGWSPWSPKVVDFGIAHAARAQDTIPASGGGLGVEHTWLSQDGGIAGTPEYMSPEQAGSGERVGPGSDIYSLGVVAYEMLCGRPPFAAEQDTSPISVLAQHLSDLPPRPSAWHSDLPPALDDALAWALAKSPSQRPASGAEFVHALRVVAVALANTPKVPASIWAPSTTPGTAPGAAPVASTYTAPASLTLVAPPVQAPAQVPVQASVPFQAPAQVPVQAPVQAVGSTRKKVSPRWLLPASITGGLCLGVVLTAAQMSRTDRADELPISVLEAPDTLAPEVIEEAPPAVEPTSAPTLSSKDLPALTPNAPPTLPPTELPSTSPSTQSNTPPTGGVGPDVGASDNSVVGGALSQAQDVVRRLAQAEDTAQRARQVKIEVIDNLLLLRKRQSQDLLRPEEAAASRRRLLLRLRQALGLCDAALRLDENNETAWEQKAAVFFLMGRFADALITARQGLERFPDNRDLLDARDKARQRLRRAAQKRA